MVFQVEFQEILAVAAGVLILAIPRLLNYIVATYLIIYGVLGIIYLLHPR